MPYKLSDKMSKNSSSEVNHLIAMFVEYWNILHQGIPTCGWHITSLCLFNYWRFASSPNGSLNYFRKFEHTVSSPWHLLTVFNYSCLMINFKFQSFVHSVLTLSDELYLVMHEAAGPRIWRGALVTRKSAVLAFIELSPCDGFLPSENHHEMFSSD